MYLKKSILALAVSMAASSAFASTITLDGSPFVGDLVYEGGATLQGQVTGADVPVQFNNTEFKGNFINQAAIKATGYDSLALLLESAAIGDASLGAESFTGDFINTGSIVGEGESTGAVKLHNTTGGSIYNRAGAVISATGADSKGLHLSGASFNGVVQNDGLISGSDVGLDIDSNEAGTKTSTLSRIDNAGTIQATDAQGRAILIDGATIYGADRHLINTGKIVGGAVGIEFDHMTLEGDPLWPAEPGAENFFQIVHEEGEISGGQHAILGAAGRVDLLWGNSEGRGEAVIRGDIDGVAMTYVLGPVQYHGNVISSEVVRVVQAGTLNLNHAHTVIDGNLDVLGGTLGMPISDATRLDTPVLKVTGDATLAAGSKVLLVAKGSDFAAGGKEYQLIDASTLNVADNVKIQSSSALLNVKGYTIENGQMKVVVETGTEDNFEELVTRGGGNANAVSAGRQFMTVAGILGRDNPNDPVLAALAKAGSDEKAIAAIIKQMSPEANGGSAAAALGSQNLVSGVISSRSSNLRGLSSGEGIDGTGFWLQALSSDASQGVRSGIEGYDADSKGLALGVDRKLNDQTTLGLSYSFVDTDVQSDSGNKTQVDSHVLTAYGSWSQDNFFVDAGVNYGINHNESTRYIAGTKAEGNYDSTMFGLNAMAGYGFDTGFGLLVEPRVAARYSNIKIDGFTEKGSSAALTTGDQRLEVGEIGAGVRLAGVFAMGNGSLEPEMTMMTYHDLIGDKSSSTSAFVLGGDTFVTSGATPTRNSYEVGFGATYKLGNVSVGASYDRLMKTGYDADAFTAKVRYDF